MKDGFFWTLFFTVGLVCSAGGIGYLLYFIIMRIFDWFYSLYYIKRAEKRDNGPPTAACFCRDCQFWHPDIKHCFKFGIDNENMRMFCGKAKAIDSKKWAQQRENQLKEYGYIEDDENDISKADTSVD